ncbi:MAG: hypothetical protein UD936_01205 [Acutalibacteraceae bacterium]|nr:hypothetical protein [Acutalibacteraceae bacterium]
MKNDFKELFNSFDENDFDDDFMNLGNIDICDDTAMDIDIAKIKADVFDRVGIKNKKRCTGKNFRVLLIAAVLVMSITICSTVIYASGTVQSIFGEFFGGNITSAGLYESNDLSISTTDECLNIELLGVTGDERKLYTVLEVTKKDGSALTDEGYKYPFWLTNEGESLWDYYECYVAYEDKDGNYFGPCGDSIDYSLSKDKKSLKIMVMLSAKERNLQGATISIVSKSFGASKVIEALDQKASKSDGYYTDLVEERQKELGIDDTSCREIFNGEFYEYAYTENKKYELPFKVSFTIDIDDKDRIKKRLTVKNAPDFVDPIADKVNMEISSFGMNIYCECNIRDYLELDYKNRDNICHKIIDYSRSEIIMDDGTEYFFYCYDDEVKGVVQHKHKESHYEENIMLSLTKIPGGQEDGETYLINTSEIRTVILNDNVVYRKSK